MTPEERSLNHWAIAGAVAIVVSTIGMCYTVDRYYTTPGWPVLLFLLWICLVPISCFPVAVWIASKIAPEEK